MNTPIWRLKLSSIIQAVLLSYLLSACGFGQETPLTLPVKSAISNTPKETAPIETDQPPTLTLLPKITQLISPTATNEVFDWNTFRVEEIKEDTEIQIEFDPNIDSLIPGTYLLYLRDMIVRDKEGNGSFELWYISINGRLHGRVLSIQGALNLIAVSRNPQNEQLLLAQFEENHTKAWVVDWRNAIIRGFTAYGSRGLAKEERIPYLQVSPYGKYSFSPNGHWLVWDCEPEDVAAYCLIDLELGDGLAVFPFEDYSDSNRVPGFYTWSPDGEWFLAECKSVINVDSGAQCLVWLDQGVIERWEYKTWVEAGIFPPTFFVRRHSISPDGENLFIVLYPNFDKGEENSHIIVLDRLDIVEGTYKEKLRFEFSAGGGWEAIWSFSGDLLALSYSIDTLPSSLDPGPATLVILDVVKKSSYVVADHLSNGARVIGWSPDGEWIVTNCGDRHPYAVCVLSIDGFFRPLVLNYENSRQEFLGWFVVP
jgi:hypothetical protein